MAKSEALEEYRRKRDFTRSPEPRPGKNDEKSAAEERTFVVQKHDARRLHYDFRLEVDSVLKSWAVPKGPSIDPKVKRLAIQTEDHPLDYAAFEGVIPKGHYGAGPVIVWDHGFYHNLTEEQGEELPAGEAIERGHISVWLDGLKLKGGYALTRIGRGPRPWWLLVKMRDEFADGGHDPVVEEPESVLSRKTLEDLEAGAAARRG